MKSRTEAFLKKEICLWILPSTQAQELKAELPDGLPYGFQMCLASPQSQARQFLLINFFRLIDDRYIDRWMIETLTT